MHDRVLFTWVWGCEDTGTTVEHSLQCTTVTTESRWHEILARQQNSPQLDPEQGRIETVHAKQSRRDSQAEIQGGMGVLLNCQESSRSWFKRSASLATERRQNLVVWVTMVDSTEDWPVTPEDLPTPKSLLEEKKSTSAMLVTMKGETGITALVNPNDYSKLQRLGCMVARVSICR